MRRAALLLATIVGMACIAEAQPQRGSDGDRGFGRRGDRGGFRERGGPGEGFGGPRRGPGRQGMDLDRMADRLANTLELDENQRGQFDAIVDEYREAFDQMRAQREEHRELAMAYREARRSGDDERAEELRAQMAEFGGGRRELMESFVAEIEPILDETQIERFREIQSRMRERGERSRQRHEMRRMIEELPDQLGMTEEQRAEYNAMLESHREERRAHREQMRPLIEEMREARRNGDAERVEEIRAELEANRPQRRGPEAIIEQVMTILTPEQQAQFREIRSNMAGQGRRGPKTDLRTVLSAAQRLDLRPEQRKQMREVLREARRARGKGRMSRQQDAELAETIKGQLMEILDADQKVAFEENLERAERSRPGKGRGDRDRGHRRDRRSDRPRGDGPRGGGWEGF